MMTCSPKETYWGWKLLDPSPEEAKLLGAEGDYLAHGIDHAEVEEVLTRISRDGTLNARQAMEAAKGAFSEGVSPVFPPDVTVDIVGQSDVHKLRSRVSLAPVPPRRDKATQKEEAGVTEAKEAEEELRGRSR